MHRHPHKTIGITVNQGNMTPPKEYSKFPGIDTKQMEIDELPDKDFKIKTEPKFTRSRDITKIRGEINKIENRKTIEKINKTNKSCFLERNKIDKPLAKKRRERTQVKL